MGIDQTPSSGSDQEQSAATKITLTTTQQLAFVNNGIRLILYGVIAQLCASLLGFLSFIPFLPSLSGFIALAGKISILIGYVFSLFAPEKTDARKFILAALLVIVMGGIITELAAMILKYSSIDVGIRVFAVLATVAFAMPLVSVIFYLYFLKSIADFTKQSGKSEEAEKLAVILMAITGIQLLIQIPLALLSISGLGIVSYIVGFVFLVASVIWLILFIQFLDSLEFRKRIGSTSGTGGGGSPGEAW